MFCYLDQYGISEDETRIKIITRKTTGPEFSANLKSFPENIP